MNLDYLKTYLEVVRLGSFSEAARKLSITQPAVSFQINKLERDLGVRLIDRSQKSITMTEAGKRLFQDLGFATDFFGLGVVAEVFRFNQQIDVREFIVFRVIAQGCHVQLVHDVFAIVCFRRTCCPLMIREFLHTPSPQTTRFY